MLTIFHTNDFHNMLASNQADFIRTARENAGSCSLLLDAGDAVSAGNITYHAAGEPILSLMSETGYDAMTVGNRDFHLTKAGFHSKLSNARFPILSANIASTGSKQDQNQPHQAAMSAVSLSAVSLDENSLASADNHSGLPPEKNDPPCVSHIVREVPGFGRVVIFGVTVAMITRKMLVRKVSAYVFEDPIVVGTHLAAELRATYAPDLLIALTHIGIAQDRLLAERAQTIDILIGGHSHVLLEKGEYVGRTLIVQAGSHGKYLGRVTVERSVQSADTDVRGLPENRDDSEPAALVLNASVVPLPAPEAR